MAEPDRMDSSEEQEPIEKQVTHTLEEARMVLPGVQALLGFQLIAVYNQPFDKILTAGEQRLHLVGFFLTAITVVLLMTPAAYHRQNAPDRVSCSFVKLASRLLTAGMFTLMLSIWVDCYLLSRIILKDTLWSLVASLCLGVVQTGLWFVLPRWRTLHTRPSRT